MNPITCKISTACAFDAFDDIGYKLNPREKAVVVEYLDPNKTGKFDFS
jgi:hypothetical protein